MYSVSLLIFECGHKPSWLFNLTDIFSFTMSKRQRSSERIANQSALDKEPQPQSLQPSNGRDSSKIMKQFWKERQQKDVEAAAELTRSVEQSRVMKQQLEEMNEELNRLRAAHEQMAKEHERLKVENTNMANEILSTKASLLTANGLPPNIRKVNDQPSMFKKKT